MDDATLTSSIDVRMMDRHILEQLLMIRPLLRKEGSDAAAADDGGDAAARDVVKEIAKECMALNKDQSKDLLLAVLLDALLLHLLDDEEEGRVEVSSSAASDQQLMDNAAAVMKKKAAAAAKKKRNKRNKAASKQKHKRGTKRMTWLGGGIIPRIMMVVFGSITTLIVAFSLIHQSDGSGNVKAPPALPPSTITSSLRQMDLQSISMPSLPRDIMSPSPVPVVPIFSLTERKALIDFYDSAKGADWTDKSLWLDESTSYCDWKGVTCDDNGHVTELQLSTNGLSGRLSKSIGNLTFIEALDLSDNDIKGSIPSEIGKLSNLKYLRLSYNAFTGTTPKELGELTKLQLLQLQSNRITNITNNIPRLNDNIYGRSTFVADCGVPSAFEEPLECKNCTMCCNANGDCTPQVFNIATQVAESELGLTYGTIAAICFACFFFVCYMIVLVLYAYDRYKILEEEQADKSALFIALSKIYSDSVYSYLITDNVFGWLVALVTLGIQSGVLAFFIMASDANFEDFESLYTWKCPRDNIWCNNTAEVTVFGWVVFAGLMTAFLAKDFISGCKLIYHSTKVRYPLSSRIRYYFVGVCLCLVTLFAVYASAVYSDVISKNTAELIVNSVVILFVMELDERVFSTLTAYNQKWSAHVEDNTIDVDNTIDEMKNEIASQQEEMRSTIDEMKNDFEVMGRKLDEMKNAFEVHKAVSFDFSSVV